MRWIEDKEKGLYVIEPEPGAKLKWGRMKYRGDWAAWACDCILLHDEFELFVTRKQAEARAKSIGWPLSSVERVASRFERVWGIRNDPRNCYFLADWD